MSKRNKDAHTDKPRSEREAILYEMNLQAYINQRKGQYIRADDGSLHLIIGGKRIPLSFDRKNYSLATLMLDACQVTSLSQGSQGAIQRLQIKAHRNASSIVLKHFSGLSQDGARLYVPVSGGQLLCVTAGEVRLCANGDNKDKFWIEHPNNMPFRYKVPCASDGLSLFQRLIVDTQSCRIPAMRWLVAMHEGYFPYVRGICRARFLLVHVGGTQQGKTTGAERFTQLHGLGEVKGDYSVAALANMPDPGLLVMDNREQANFTQQLIDYCLFLATGAERGRSSTEGQIRTSSSRPVGVITSIEGAWKAELQARCVEVLYEINGTKVDRDDIEDEILEKRDEILSAMVPVFQVWLRRRPEQGECFSRECPIPNFERHFSTLADLLRAYAEVSGKPLRWAEEIIGEWTKQLKHQGSDAEDELESPLLLMFRNVSETIYDYVTVERNVAHDGEQGTLYITEVGVLLDALRKACPRDVALPKNATGLGRRLRSARFQAFRFLDHEIAPHLSQLARTATRRPIGFFVTDDEVTDG